MSKPIQEKNGTWTIKERIKCDDGEFHPMTIRGYQRKRDAIEDYDKQVELFKAKWLKKSNTLRAKLVGDNTFESVVEEFYQNYKLKNKLSTAIKMRGMIDNRLYYYFDKDSLCDDVFVESKINQWKSWLLEQPITKKSVNLTMGIMKKIIDRAIRRNKVSDKDSVNVCYLSLENIRVDEPQKKSVDFWLPSEYKQFIDTFDYNDKFRVVFETFYHTGIRCGELLGLQWKHFDIQRHSITIEQQLNNKLQQGKGVITSPKTKNAYREINLNKKFYDYLMYYREATYNDNDEDFIFFGKKPTAPTTIRDHLEKHIKLSGVKHIRIHDLRHTHASLLINLGATPKLIMERLGHASYDETMGTYGHLFPNLEITILEQLDCVDDTSNYIPKISF